MIAAEHKRHETQQHEDAVILMEENIEQVLLVRVLPHPKCFVVNVPVMVIENQFPDKRRVQNGKIDRNAHGAHLVARGEPIGQKRAGQADEHGGIEKNVSVPVHAPPKAVPKAMIEFFPLPGQGSIISVKDNKKETKNRANEGRDAKELYILLYAIKK